MRKTGGFPVLLVAVAFAAACGDRAEQQPAPPAGGAPTTQPAAPGAAAPPAAGPATTVDLPPGVTPEMVAQGQQLYRTVCVACHGDAGVGTPLGPAMNDQNWIHITGEFEEIVNITTTGVPQPQQYPAPMPPQGGGNFTPEQIRAIAAYVYTLSHGG